MSVGVMIVCLIMILIAMVLTISVFVLVHNPYVELVVFAWFTVLGVGMAILALGVVPFEFYIASSAITFIMWMAVKERTIG